METSQWFVLGSIAAYLLFVIVVGVICARRNENVGDFYLGGRKLGPLVTAMSAEASDMSSWLLMGLPGVAYLCGLADATWTAIGLAVGTYINWLIVAKRLRRYSQRIGAITIPDFFSERYKDNSCLLKGIAALAIIVFFVPYTASGFAACGKLFASLFGADYMMAMLLSAVVIVAYTALGGFLAASTTDLIQSIVMTIALVCILGFGLVTAGGYENVIANASELPGYLSLVKSYDSAAGAATSYGWLTIISTTAWGLGYFGMPHILLRFMAIEDDRKLKMSRRIASIWVVIAMAVAIIIGVIGYQMSANGSISMLTGADSETIIVKIAGLLSQNGALAAIIAGVVLAGILAATMSTADSQLLAAASSMSENILVGVFKLKMSEKARMVIARLTVIVIAVIGAFIARDQSASVFKIVSFAWAGFGAAFGPVMLFSLFWRRSNRWGALAGMLSGGITVFVWKFKVRPLGGLWDIYELLPAFIVACFFIVVVSLITRKPSDEITTVYDEIKKGMRFDFVMSAPAETAEAAVAAETAEVAEAAEVTETVEAAETEVAAAAAETTSVEADEAAAASAAIAASIAREAGEE